MSSLPPGPPGHWLLGHLPAFRHDMLGFFTRLAREHGDLVPFRLGYKRFVLVSGPELIEQVLVADNRHYRKHYVLRMLRPTLGDGLLTNEGDAWLRQRRLIQPLFHRKLIEGYGEIITAHASRLLAEWQSGATRDIHADMMRVTLGVVAEALLGVDVAHDVEDVGRSLNVILADFSRRFAGFFPLPLWVPTPNNFRCRAAIRRLERIIRRLIVERRGTPSARPDLLARLVAARDNGVGMNDRQMRDELMTMLLAGHDTTANALTWTLWFLSRRPEAADRVVCELAEALGGRTPTAADLPRLRYLDATLRESMRLYPPVYSFGREAVTDCDIGGFPIRAGTNVLMSQWVVHRDPRWFDDPDAFRPERWLDGLADRLPHYAYFPFGGGPRVCIGNTFATTEAMLILATLLPRFRLRVAPGATVTPWPSVTLRPRDGLPMVLAARATITAGVETG